MRERALIYLLGSGQAACLPDGQHDYALDCGRELSPEGENYLAARRGDLNEPYFDVVASSFTTRAIQTAARFANIEPARVTRVKELYLGDPALESDGAEMATAFKELGENAVLVTYLEHRFAPALFRFGSAASAAILDLIKKKPDATTFLISGHPICHHLTALELVSKSAPRDRDEWEETLYTQPLPPGGIIRLDLDTSDNHVVDMTIL